MRRNNYHTPTTTPHHPMRASLPIIFCTIIGMSKITFQKIIFPENKANNSTYKHQKQPKSWGGEIRRSRGDRPTVYGGAQREGRSLLRPYSDSGYLRSWHGVNINTDHTSALMVTYHQHSCWQPSISLSVFWSFSCSCRSNPVNLVNPVLSTLPNDRFLQYGISPHYAVNHFSCHLNAKCCSESNSIP